ncbi:ZPR1 zinc finger domain-containing protein [Acidiplasma aeolicum]|jgi:zinc finger protein|uniref:ZPR1 zinc finger domain-containing protein n=1 Tax=Acidiplasma aeolicum TaxID=507754 RepID=UPI00371BB795
MNETLTDKQCPNCNSYLYYIEYDTEIPYEGKITIKTYTCKTCYYKNVSIQRHEREKPKVMLLRITGKNDLKTIIYRSPDAYIKIPEIDAEISPGIASNGYITTAEGIITSIKEKLSLMGNNKETKVLEERINNILKNNSEEITIIIDDDSGKSKINSSKAKIIEKPI